MMTSLIYRPLDDPCEAGGITHAGVDPGNISAHKPTVVNDESVSSSQITWIVSFRAFIQGQKPRLSRRIWLLGG